MITEQVDDAGDANQAVTSVLIVPILIQVLQCHGQVYTNRLYLSNTSYNAEANDNAKANEHCRSIVTGNNQFFHKTEPSSKPESR